MSESRWYHSENGRALGPVSEQVLRGMIKESKLGADDLIWTAGMGRWETVEKLKPEWLKFEAPVTAAPVPVAVPASKPVVKVAEAPNQDKNKTGKVVLKRSLPTPSGVAKPDQPKGPDATKPQAQPKSSVVAKPVEAQPGDDSKGEKKGIFGRLFKR